MMIDPIQLTCDSTTDHPYRTGPAPRTFDPDSSRVPYDGQTRMRLTISSGLAHARIVIDPAARDLLAIDCGDGPRPRIRLAGGELALTWRRLFGDWLRDLFTPGLSDVAIVLHPAVEWTIAIRGGLARGELDLSAGTVARIDIAGGCSDVLLDLPLPAAVVPIRISGGASHLGIRRPAETGVGLDVAGGLAMLRLDDRTLGAIGGPVQLDTGDVTRGAPHYELTLAGGASDLSIVRR
jgi:hypothetical protein